MAKSKITYNLPDEWKPAVNDYWDEVKRRYGKDVTILYKAQRIVIEMLMDSKDHSDPARWLNFEQYKLKFHLGQDSNNHKELMQKVIDLIDGFIDVTYEKGWIFKRKVVTFKPGVIQNNKTWDSL